MLAHEFGIGFESAADNFVLPSLVTIRHRFRRNPLRAYEDNFVQAPTVLWHAQQLSRLQKGSQRRRLA